MGEHRVLCEIRAVGREWTSLRRAREELCVQGPEAGGGLVLQNRQETEKEQEAGSKPSERL